MIKIFIIIFLLIIVNYLYKKNQINYKNEYFGSLLETTVTQYNINKSNTFDGSRIQIKPSNTLNIQSDLSANIISAFDISATNINTTILPINSNDIYNKISLNTQNTKIISEIKEETIIQHFNTYNNTKNYYTYDPVKTYIYDDIATYNNISGYTNGHDASGWFGSLTLDSSGYNTNFTRDVSVNRVYTFNWENSGDGNWGGQHIYQITPNTSYRGIQLSVPQFCNVLWIGLLSYNIENRHNYFSICDINNICYGIYGAGRNMESNIAPGGVIATNPYDSWITWVAIPLYWLNVSATATDNKVILNCYYPANTPSIWITKCAFSSNPWNHCSLLSSAIYYNLNCIKRLPSNNPYANFNIPLESTPNLVWDGTTNDWYGTNIVKITANTNAIIRIPIIKSGKNKILYFVTLNQNAEVESLQVSLVGLDQSLSKLPNLRTTFSNPFSRHFNSKRYNLYMATIIPDSSIVLDQINRSFVTINRSFVTINLFSPIGCDFWFKEIGTHDEK